MGTSTDAILFYGYIWSDECNLFADGDDDEESDEREWEEILLERRGVSNPWTEHPGTETAGQAWMTANQKRIDEWYAAKEAIHDEYGVEIRRHGSDQWSVPYIHIDDERGHVRASRGHPEQVTAEMLTVGEDWDARLARFVADLGIDIAGDEDNEVKGPGWFLASWWG